MVACWAVAAAGFGAAVSGAQACERPEVYLAAEISGLRASAEGALSVTLDYLGGAGGGLDLSGAAQRQSSGRYALEERIGCIGEGVMLGGRWRAAGGDTALFLPLRAYDYGQIGRGRAPLALRLSGADNAFFASVHREAPRLLSEGRGGAAAQLVARSVTEGLAHSPAALGEAFSFFARNRAALWRGDEAQRVAALGALREMAAASDDAALAGRLYSGFLTGVFEDRVTGLPFLGGTLGDYALAEMARVAGMGGPRAWGGAAAGLAQVARARDYEGCFTLALGTLEAIQAAEDADFALDGAPSAMTRVLTTAARCLNLAYRDDFPESDGALGADFIGAVRANPQRRALADAMVAVIDRHEARYPPDGAAAETRLLRKYYPRLRAAIAQEEGPQ